MMRWIPFALMAAAPSPRHRQCAALGRGGGGGGSQRLGGGHGAGGGRPAGAGAGGGTGALGPPGPGQRTPQQPAPAGPPQQRPAAPAASSSRVLEEQPGAVRRRATEPLHHPRGGPLPLDPRAPGGRQEPHLGRASPCASRTPSSTPPGATAMGPPGRSAAASWRPSTTGWRRCWGSMATRMACPSCRTASSCRRCPSPPGSAICRARSAGSWACP